MRLLAAALLAAAVAACSGQKPSEPSPPRDRPLAQDGTVARVYTSAPDRARIQLDLAAVRTALQAWRGERGSWPASLDELKVEGLSYRADLRYDPATGTVRSETYPSY